MATKNIIGTIQIKRGTSDNWTTKNPILESGELGYDETAKRVKIGDGRTTWTNLSWFHDKVYYHGLILKPLVNESSAISHLNQSAFASVPIGILTPLAGFIAEDKEYYHCIKRQHGIRGGYTTDIIECCWDASTNQWVEESNKKICGFYEENSVILSFTWGNWYDGRGEFGIANDKKCIRNFDNYQEFFIKPIFRTQ